MVVQVLKIEMWQLRKENWLIPSKKKKSKNEIHLFGRCWEWQTTSLIAFIFGVLASTASTSVTHWNWVEQAVKHTTQALHLLWLTESGTNSVCWVECLHLTLLHDGETRNTITVATAMTHWKCNKHCLFILLIIEWSVCILPPVG